MKKIIILFILFSFTGVTNAQLSYNEKNTYSNLLNNAYSQLENNYSNDIIINKLNIILTRIKKVKITKYNRLNPKSKDLIYFIEKSIKNKVRYFKSKGEVLDFNDIFNFKEEKRIENIGMNIIVENKF
jgi:hypothetical protein